MDNNLLTIIITVLLIQNTIIGIAFLVVLVKFLGIMRRVERMVSVVEEWQTIADTVFRIPHKILSVIMKYLD